MISFFFQNRKSVKWLCLYQVLDNLSVKCWLKEIKRPPKLTFTISCYIYVSKIFISDCFVQFRYVPSLLKSLVYMWFSFCRFVVTFELLISLYMNNWSRSSSCTIGLISMKCSIAMKLKLLLYLHIHCFNQ